MVTREGGEVRSLPLYPPGAKARHRHYGWSGEIGHSDEDKVAVIWKGEVGGHWAAGSYEASEIEVEASQICLL